MLDRKSLPMALRATGLAVAASVTSAAALQPTLQPVSAPVAVTRIAAPASVALPPGFHDELAQVKAMSARARAAAAEATALLRAQRASAAHGVQS